MPISIFHFFYDIFLGENNPIYIHTKKILVPVAQLVTCLTADPGVLSLIPAQSHTFVEIDHEIISMAILLLSADLRRVVVSYK